MIYLLRHGEIPQNFPRRFIGQTEMALTDRGQEQARWWRGKLAGVPFEAVYSSDLGRCRHTADIVTDGGEVTLEPRLREITLGSWEGLSVEEVQERFPDQWEARGADLAGYRPDDGESFDDLLARALPALEEIADRHSGPVLVVTHAGVIHALVSMALGLDLQNLFNFAVDYASLSLLERRDGSWVLGSLNQQPELE